MAALQRQETLTSSVATASKRRSQTFVVSILALGAFTFAWPIYLWGNPAHFVENGPVEGLQWIYLAFTVGFFGWSILRPEPLTRLEMSGLTLFVFNLLIRETDVRGTWAEPVLGGLFLHGREFFFLAGLWVNVVGMTLVRFFPTMRDLIGWLRGPAGIAMIVGCLFYAAAEPAEKHRLFPDKDLSEALEETLETYGCYFIFLSGLITAFGTRRGVRRNTEERAVVA